MGVNLTPLIIWRLTRLPDLVGKKLVIDGCNQLFRYLSKIRKGGEILYNGQSDPVSHIIGFFYLTVNLLERRIRPIYVFDGYPPEEKRPKSPGKINRLVALWQMYERQDADHKQLFKDPLFLYDKIISDLQEFVRFMGCPVVRGIGEGEAQGARLVREGKAYGMITEDQDALLLGCPRTYHELYFKEEVCKCVDLQYQLDRWNLTQSQLVDVGLLVGTDFNGGIKGIGPKRALRLIREYGCIEEVPDLDFPHDLDRLRALFLAPATISATPVFRAPNTQYLVYYLRNKGWNPKRIERGIARLRFAFKHLHYKQADLMTYLEE